MSANSNTTVNNFIPEIWEAAVYRTLEDNLVGKKVCKNKSDLVADKGDTIHFNGLADPTISSYTGSVSYENLQDSTVSLLIDQDNYYAFKTDDLDGVMANVDVKGSQAERSAYQLKRTCDSYIMGLYGESANTTITDATCDTATIFSTIGEAKKVLAENNVEESNMWMVIPPWVQLKLELAGIKFSINEGINGKGGMKWCDVLGFDIFVSNQVNNNGTVYNVMAGSYDAMVYAESLMDSEALRAQTAFENYVRGRHVFGAKVIKPLELVHLALTEAAETTI
jgi:hypothetical protein